jgi:hypothetical protein
MADPNSLRQKELNNQHSLGFVNGICEHFSS